MIKLSEQLKQTRWLTQRSPLDGLPYRCVTMENDRLAEIERLEADSELLNDLIEMLESQIAAHPIRTANCRLAVNPDRSVREAFEDTVKEWKEQIGALQAAEETKGANNESK